MSYDKKTWVDGEYIYPEQLNHIEHGIEDLNDEYAPSEWVSGDIISSARLNHIEDGVYSLHDDYEKTNWKRNDIVTAERLNHIEDNIYKILEHTITAVATNGTIPATTGWEIVGDVATKVVLEGEPYGDLPVPTRSGYNFTGWFTESTGGTQVTSETIMGDSDVAIYAQWVQESYGTVLYTDGTFIINEPASQRAANIQAHGAVTNEYSAWDGENVTYDFSGELPLWYQQKSNIKHIIVAQSITPTLTTRWFYNCSELLTVDLSLLDTSNTTHMYRMFCNCSKVQVFDLSGFDTQNVITMEEMFSGCSALTTIIVSQQFVTTNVSMSAGMFKNCTNLVGGAGTQYSSSYQTAVRAKIDGGVGDEGYFTAA